MREIRFRAWDGNAMFNVDVLAISECTWDCPDYGRRGVSLAYQPSIKVMQYTCLKDKNGTEIYEGDIVKTKHNNEVLIKWIKTRLYPCRQGKTGQYNKVTNWDCVTRGEVIGNIYENPELLGGAE